jgi:hypothetical protein
LVEIFYLPLLPVLAHNYKQHILSLAKLRKVCYSLAELCVKFVYLNVFEWRGGGVKFMKHLRGRKLWEPIFWPYKKEKTRDFH